MGKEVKTARQFITEQYEREFNSQGSPNYEPKDTEDFLFTYGDEMERAAEQYASQSVRIALEGQKADYDDVLEDHRRLVREIDEIISGKDGMAKQASLCDLVGPIQKLVEGQKGPVWVKAIKGLPEIENHKKLSVKYKGEPELLHRINNTWFWFNENDHMKYPLDPTSLQVIEYLSDASPSSPAQPGDGEKDQFAIGFAAWTDENWYRTGGENYYYHDGEGGVKYTPEELITIYKSSLEKEASKP